MSKTRLITVYTDGGCSASNGVAGWAAILIYPDGTEKEMSGHFLGVTNNQMELWAVVEALCYIRTTEVDESHLHVNVISDSEYVVNGSTQWLKKWKLKKWKSSTGEVKNKPLWQVLDTLLEGLSIDFMWVRGHTGNAMNERVDKLAVGAYRKIIDERKLTKKKK